VSGDVCNTGSGKALMATLLTLAAATAPPVKAAALKNSRLEVMLKILSFSGHRQRRRQHWLLRH
jgi:hypothetical protein